MNNTITCENWAMELTINPATGRIDSVEIITTNTATPRIDLDVTEHADGWHLDGYHINETYCDSFAEIEAEMRSARAAAKHFQTVINAIETTLAA